MNSNEVKAVIVRKGYSQKDVAELMGMNIHTFRKKINGVMEFKDKEKLALADILELTPQQIFDWLCDGKVPELIERLRDVELPAAGR